MAKIITIIYYRGDNNINILITGGAGALASPGGWHEEARRVLPMGTPIPRRPPHPGGPTWYPDGLGEQPSDEPGGRRAELVS